MAAAFSQQAPIEGNPKAAIRVIIYEDLQCPDCAVFRSMLDETLLPRFKSAVAFEHRDFPLAKHVWARKAAIAARYFATVSPGVSLEFRRVTMAHIQDIGKDGFDAHLEAFARAHQIDPAKVTAALSDAKLAAEVESDYRDGVARGVAHTPTVLVDGEPFIESFPVEDVVKSIERALQSTRP
ncbi:MAG: DsbA family protein [Acidobacteriia bacterium]|nr:DsbA family protein [Terriglobia bacterium]